MCADWTYERRYVSCGKLTCSRCGSGGAGHGPYWYGYRREGGKVRSKYFGKRDPRLANAAPPPPPTPDRWSHGKRMDYVTALRIMGFGSKPTKRELKARYRELMLEHHPDAGGAHRIAVAVNLANAYLSL